MAMLIAIITIIIMIMTMVIIITRMIEGIEEICASLGLGKVPLLNAENRSDH